MKITENTPERLVAEEVPWLLSIGLVLATLLILIIGLVKWADGEAGGPWYTVLGGGFMATVTFGFMRRTRLVLDRASGMAELKRRTVMGTLRQTWPLAEIAGARVEDYRDRVMTHRAVLVLAGGAAVPISPVFESGPGAARNVALIEAWLHGT